MQATTYAVVISGDCQVESFGARLKREREQRKITLDEISISTKIATRFLVALEEERFDQLPGGIFNKSFVKAYAHHLGIDEAQAVADYVAASGPVAPEANPEQSPELAVLAGRVPEAPDSAGGIPWEMFAVGLLIVACGFALWGFYSREKPPQPRPAEAPAASSQPSEVQPKASDSAKPASPSQDSALNATGAFLVLVKAREDSWVSISADGKQIVQDTLPAESEKSIQARKEIVIKTGNAGALDISYNGKKVPAPGSYAEVKTLTFDVNGLRP